MQVFLQSHQFSLPTTLPLVLPDAGKVRPFEATETTKAFSFTPLLTILRVGIKYGTHVDNTPTNFVPLLHSNEIRKLTELKYGPLS
jgi:hypothetical protein